MSEIVLNFIFESLCYIAKQNPLLCRQISLTYVDRGILSDEQITALSEILKEFE